MNQNIPLGVDFGTTYSCCSVWKDGGLLIVPNGIGERTTPSVVIFDSPDNVFVGEETLYHFPKKFSVKIYEIKRLLGREYDEIKNIKDILPYNIIKEKNGTRPKIKIDFDNKISKEYYPEEIATLILKKLISNAESFLSTQIHQLLITVPADFNENQKNAVRYSALQIPGIVVLKVINEPSAAILAYGFPKIFLKNKFYPFNKYFTLVKEKGNNNIADSINSIFHPMEEMSMTNISNSQVSNSLIQDQLSESNNGGNNIENSLIILTKDNYMNNGNLKTSLLSQNKNEMKILVFDLGGGTFDVSLILVKENKDYETMAYKGDQKLGGSDFDNKIMEFCLDKFCLDNNYDKKEIKNNYKCIERLKRACEETKKCLSIKECDTIFIDDFYDSKPLCHEITRNKFEELCKDLFLRLIKPLDDILKEQKLNNTDIDEIILVGGSSKIPKVKEIIQNKFQNIPINDEISPDEVVAFGACILAESIIRDSEDNIFGDIAFCDKTGHNYGIEIEDGEMDILIPKGTKYPFTTKDLHLYHTVYDFQRTFEINVFEGEGKYTYQNKLIGNFELKGIPQKPKGEVFMQVKMKIDTFQNITIIAIVKENNKTQKLVVDRKNQYPNIQNNNNLIRISQNELNDEERDNRLIIFQYSNDFIKQKNNKDRFEIIKKYNLAMIKYLNFLEKNYKDTYSEKYLFLLDKLFKSYIYFFSESMKIFLQPNEKEEIKNTVKLYLKKIREKAPFRIKQLISHFKALNNDIYIQRLEIFVYAMELLYDKAMENFNKKEKNHVKLSKALFEECLIISKGYIQELDQSKLNPDLKIKYNKIIADCQKKTLLISSISIEEINILKEKEKLFTNEKKLNSDDLCLLRDNIEFAVKKLSLIENLSSNEEASETQSFYLANIVKIELLKKNNMNLQNLLKLAEESINIADKLKNKNVKNKLWYKEIVQIKNEIFNKLKSEHAAPTTVQKIDIDEIEEKFDDILNNKGNEELIKYILKNYPYKGPKINIEESLEEYKKNKKRFLNKLSNKYTKDNFALQTMMLNEKYDIDNDNNNLNDIIIEFINKMIDNI